MAWEVPHWLQPPNESERRRLEAMEGEVKAKAASMLRKSVGVARMQEEAAQLQATGMDPLDARKKALLDNASLIFADEPEALARLIDSADARRIQERTAASLERWREAQAEGVEGRLTLGMGNLQQKYDAMEAANARHAATLDQRAAKQEEDLAYKYSSLEARIADRERLADLKERSQEAVEEYRKARLEHDKLSLEERKDHNQVMEALRERADENLDMYRQAQLQIREKQAEFQGGFITVTNPVTGKVEAAWRQSPTTAKLTSTEGRQFSPDSSVKKMEARVEAINALRAAEKSGNAAAIEQARLRLESIEHAQGYNNPSFAQKEAIKRLYDAKAEVDKQLALFSGLQTMTPELEARKKALEKQRDDIQAEINKVTARASDAKPAPPPSTNTLGTNAINIGRFRAIIR